MLGRKFGQLLADLNRSQSRGGNVIIFPLIFEQLAGENIMKLLFSMPLCLAYSERERPKVLGRDTSYRKSRFMCVN